jgi:hypothetical protein
MSNLRPAESASREYKIAKAISAKKGEIVATKEGELEKSGTLERDNDEPPRRVITTWERLMHVKKIYLIIFAASLTCLAYAGITSFAHAPHGAMSGDCKCTDGLEECICKREAIYATTRLQMFCLAMARCSAYADYINYMLLFLTKANNLRTYLQRTYLSEFVPFYDLHAIHVISGTIVGVEVMWHTFWHLLRWGLQGNIGYITSTQTGLTGLICVCLTPLIVWPMRLPQLKKVMSYELRKSLHYLSVVWGGVIMYHAPATHIYTIIGCCLILYSLDWIYGFFNTTRLIENAAFTRLENAVQIKFQAPPDFKLQGAGYCYLNVPWVDQYEFHAFSIFSDASREDDDNTICMCIAVGGDWTSKLHQAIDHPSVRPCWVSGPFSSPYQTAMGYDNVIAVASGIGITPAISIINAYKDTRKMHLIWTCRDASLVEFFIDHGMSFDDDAWTFIHYTGKRNLQFRRKLPGNVLVCLGRPKLEPLLVSIIQDSEQGQGLAREFYMASDNFNESTAGRSPAARFYDEVDRLLATYSLKELHSYAASLSGSRTKEVSREGFAKTLRALCKENFLEEEITAIFDEADDDRGGTISEDEFIGFIQSFAVKSTPVTPVESGKVSQKDQEMVDMESGKNSEKKGSDIAMSSPKAAVDGAIRRSSAIMGESGAFLFDGDDGAEAASEYRIEKPGDWNIMYCGGSDVVVKTLTDFTGKHGLSLGIEKFDW